MCCGLEKMILEESKMMSAEGLKVTCIICFGWDVSVSICVVVVLLVL